MSFDNLKLFMNNLTEWRIPGNSVIVYKDGKEVFLYSSGYSNLEKQIKMQGTELLNIYSCSKPVTAVAVMQLFEKGMFLLSDPLYDFIPEFKDMYVKTETGEIIKAERHITIQDLLTMTAGFTYDVRVKAFEKAKILTNGNMDTLTTIKCLAEEPLAFHPGEHWGYSLGYDILAGLVEVASGKKFSEYVKDNIFTPLEMEESSYHNEEVQHKMAEQYAFVAGKEKDIVKLQAAKSNDGYIENVGKEVNLIFGSNYDSGGAGITSSVNDCGKFAAMLANGGTGVNREKILSSNTVNLIKTNFLSETQLSDFNWPQLKGYGYGLGVRTMIDRVKGGSNGSFGEFGWGGAAGATLLVDTELNLGVFYAHHMLNPQEEYYQPRLRNVVYSCIQS